MFTFINTLDDLVYLNKELLQCSQVAIDTEFRRTSKDNMKLSLIQLNDSNEIYLVDCLLVKDPDKTFSFLSSNQVKKIFHSCKEDLEALYSWSNNKILNIYDTQIAHALLGGSFSISYQDLVKDKLGLYVSKEETRTNWLKRPLTEAQLNYAASDVYYLIDLYRLQIEEFSKARKLEWLDEELNGTHLLDRGTEFSQDRLFVIGKKDEKEILYELDKIVKKISSKENVNHTLFLSKQNQKALLNDSLLLGVDKSLDSITKWRKILIKKPYSDLLKNFEVF